MSKTNKELIQEIIKTKQFQELNNLVQELNKIKSEELTELRKFIEMDIIPVEGATDIILMEEYNDMKPVNDTQTKMKNIFDKLPLKLKNEILQLIASLTFTAIGNYNKTQTGGDDEIIEVSRKQKNDFLTNKNLFYSTLCLIFGLSLLYYASIVAKGLGEEFGLDLNFTGFVGLFLNPFKISGGAINKIIESVLKNTMNEMSYKVSNVCSTSGNSWIGELLTIFQDPSTKVNCALDVSSSVMISELKITKTKMISNIGYITNLVRAGNAITFTSGSTILYIVNDKSDGKLARLLQNIPVVGNFIVNNNQIAIEDKQEGGKRRSKKSKRKTKKQRKTKKSRKGRKSKKQRKSRKSRKSRKGRK